MRLPKRARYWIATMLNRRADVCWTDAVCWAEYGHNPIAELLGSATQHNCQHSTSCYCGKHKAGTNEHNRS